MDDMPAMDRKVFYRLLVEQIEREKETREEAEQGGQGKDSLLRMPTGEEIHGKSDLEKIAPNAHYASRFVRGQELRRQYEEQKSAAQQDQQRRR